MRYAIVYILLCWCSSTAYSQPVYFRHYQVEDGLANNTVFSVFQNSRGFMWFGTKEGLSRFDGGTFKAYNMKPDAKEFVYCMDEGIHRTLWVGTRKGLYEFDPLKEQFSLLGPTRDNEILDIQSDGKGKIWFTSDLQLYRFDEQQRRTRYYDLGKLSIAAICIGKDGTVWVSSVDGYLFRYDAARDMFHCVNAATQRPGEVNQIHSTENGELLIGTIRGLSCFNPADKTYRPLLGLPAHQQPVYVRHILHYAGDEYWIASESGLYSVNLQTGHTLNMQQQDGNPYSISDNAVYALYKDTEGGTWCGTYFGGINYYHSRHSYFSKYFRNSSPNSLSGNAVRELCADGQGNLWIGTEDAGLNKLNLHTGEITRFITPLASTNIHALLIDGNELWVGTFQQGLDVLDLRTGKRLRHYNADKAGNGLSSNFIISACRTRSGQIWLGTSSGVYQYQRSSGRFILADAFPEYSYVFCMYEDHEGTIWVGTIGRGLFFYHPETGKKGHFTYEAGGLSSNSVCGIFEDSARNIWISTEGGGVCKLDKGRRTFTRFNTDDGLPSNMVYKVLEDKNRTLWISTSQGLAHFDPVQHKWKVYTKAHGLLTDQFNYSSGYCDPSGTLYFGSVKGMISFNPGLMGPDTASPPVYITSFQVNNQDISMADTITLQYDQSSFAIGFAALTYIAADMTQYAYRMDGLDKDWTYLPANRKVYFTDLSPGDYTFRVKTPQSKEARLLIRISPPWWFSPVAYLVYTILALLLVYVLISAYHRRQKEKHKRKLALFEQEKEKEIYKAKIEFFTNIAHEIRTPLTLIKAPLEMVIDKVGEQPNIKKSLKNIERNTERLVALTDQLLDFRKTENQDFSLSFVQVNVPKLVQENYREFVPAAEQRSLSFSMELPEKSFYAFVDTEAFHKIMSNLIGNAVKYAAEKVEVRVAPPSGDTFCITVSNDGELIPWALREKIFEPFFRIQATEQPGSGIGLSLARALTQLHNGVLQLQPADNGMNVFTLCLPVHQKIEFRLNSVQKKTS